MESKNWNLDDVVSLDKFDELYNLTKSQIAQFPGHFKKMSPDMSDDDFLDFTKHHETTIEGMHRLSCRPSLMESADQKDSLALKLKNQVKDLEIEFSKNVRPISLWLKGKSIAGKKLLDDENAMRLFRLNPDKEYQYTYSRLMSHHSLDENSENIITAKDANGVSVIIDLRDMIETEMVYDFQPEGGELKKISNNAELSSYAYSAKPEERRAAFKARFDQYSKNIDKFFVAYQAVVKDWNYEYDLRGYGSAIGMRNTANHIQDEVIDTLMKVCSSNVGVFQRYFGFKARQLGVEKLSRFDLYAPIGDSVENYKYDEALALVDESFREFSPKFADNAKLITDQNHVDTHPSDTKRGGAFCMTVAPSVTPYVLLNYDGKGRDVSTLAHELGHGVHSIYANNHTISAQHATLPLAETASTFGEMLLFEKLLSRAKTNDAKKKLLSEKLADSYATVCRQNFIVKFEIAAHEALKSGIEEKDLSQMWLDNLKEQFGDSVDVDEMFRYEWAYIPHIIHTPFYCYAYNFGELLSMALYAKYKSEGESFVPKIEEILAAGGSEDPRVILQRVGIDMSSAEFWQGSFELIKHWQDELETL